ncbi:MAG: DUF5693 family protein, partial [Oscillospiraceae bacterium]|nr:DUF5693 family protein [Oscillospiraceae bacterium]
MSDQNLTKSKNGAIFKRVAAIIMLISFGCAMWVHLALRSPVETDDNVVGLFVEYDELWRIANTSRDLELYDMMRMAFEAGATGLVVRERILAEWEIAGDVISMFGSQLMFHLEMRYGEDAQNAVPGITISPDGTYILTRNERLHEQLFSLLEAKERYPTAFVLGDYLGLATNMHSVERAFLGLGFPLDDLEMAAEIGFYILPRLRTWEPVTEVNLAETWRWVQKIPNVVAIGFNDSTVPGG